MKKDRVFKEFRELGIIVVIFGLLYVTGLHTEVAAFAQRVILETGIMSGDELIPEEERETLDYNLDLQPLDGNTINLSEFKGKVLFINIWATWCPPCIAEMPGIQNLYEEVNNENVEFIMLSVDDSKDKAARFITKKEYTFPVYLPASQVPDVLRTSSIPTTFVVNKEGQIISKRVGMAKYDKNSFKRFLEKQADL